jgi:hypothetical protein
MYACWLRHTCVILLRAAHALHLPDLTHTLQGSPMYLIFRLSSIDAKRRSLLFLSFFLSRIQLGEGSGRGMNAAGTVVVSPCQHSLKMCHTHLCELKG